MDEMIRGWHVHSGSDIGSLWQRKPALYKSVIINAYLYLDEKIN